MNGIGNLKKMKYVRGFKICHPVRVAFVVASAVLGPSVARHTLEEEHARVSITHLLLLAANCKHRLVRVFLVYIR